MALGTLIDIGYNPSRIFSYYSISVLFVNIYHASVQAGAFFVGGYDETEI